MARSDIPDWQRMAARRLRAEMTDAERVLWRALRAHRFQEIGFRRQAPLGRYVVDFVCHARKLVIEVDGGQHSGSAKDAARDAWLQAEGYRVLRFWNNEVLGNLEGVMERIGQEFVAGTPSAPPLPNPPPRGGRGSVVPWGAGKTVIFDIGNVLIHWDIRRLYRHFLPDDAEIDRFLHEVDWFAWNLELDRGGRWGERVAELSARHPHRRALIEAAHHRWHDAVAGEIGGSVEILAALKMAEVPLYSITNFSSEKFSECQERFTFLANSFRDIVVSAVEKLVKPDPAIYRLCLERNGLTASDCVFIDDSPANVAAANALGIDGVLFTDPDTLRRDLGERGLVL